MLTFLYKKTCYRVFPDLRHKEMSETVFLVLLLPCPWRTGVHRAESILYNIRWLVCPLHKIMFRQWLSLISLFVILVASYPRLMSTISWISVSCMQEISSLWPLHCALASGAVYCNRSCLCVCGGRAVSEPYYSQRVRSVCVSLIVVNVFPLDSLPM